MHVLNKNWLTETPFDYELKKYKLLGAIQRINALVKGGYLYDSLIEVEEQLEDLYKLKNQKNEIDDRLKVLKGINLDTMSLDYDYPEEDLHLKHVYHLCDLAIDEFESVFRLIRARWRSYSAKLKITEIPHSMPTKQKGVLFVIDKKDTNIITYSYNNPSHLLGEWKDLKLNYKDINLKSIEDVMGFIKMSREESDDNRFWRCDHNLNEDLEECLLPVIKHSLYHKIMTKS